MNQTRTALLVPNLQHRVARPDLTAKLENTSTSMCAILVCLASSAINSPIRNTLSISLSKVVLNVPQATTALKDPPQRPLLSVLQAPKGLTQAPNHYLIAIFAHMVQLPLKRRQLFVLCAAQAPQTTPNFPLVNVKVSTGHGKKPQILVYACLVSKTQFLPLASHQMPAILTAFQFWLLSAHPSPHLSMSSTIASHSTGVKITTSVHQTASSTKLSTHASAQTLKVRPNCTVMLLANGLC